VSNEPILALLISDDEDIYPLVRSLISESNEPAISVDWIAGYDAAVDVIKERHHNIYLIDAHFGDRATVALIEAVANDNNKPAILLTGEGDAEIYREAMQRGATDCLARADLSAALLDRSIRYAIDRAGMLDALRASAERYAELRALYDKLSALEQLKTDMIRIGAHDLRNPVGHIIGYTELLRADLESELSEAHRMYLDSISQGAKRIQYITEDILSLERVESASNNMSQKVDLRQLVETVFKEQTEQAEKQGQIIKLQLPRAPVWIQGDAMQLHEAMANLISNAIKYTPHGGTVEVRLSVHESQALFAVEDNGYGIPEMLQTRLFEPFYRAKTLQTSSIAGTGLGLHLVKNIIKRHHGQMQFSSTYGKGSIFGFQLPLLAMQDSSGSVVSEAEAI
jgi:signal transduction histidine kinase